jgi:glycerophosphoryl diester phosphodiesterase
MSRLSLPGKPKPYVMAHRGNRVACPENTLAAFRAAFEERADILETDLHRSVDGVFVCIHDATVDRTTDGSGAVAEMTLAQLKKLSAAYGHPEFASERIPTLAELAEILPPDVALALELKSDEFLRPEVARQLVEELAQHGIQARSVVLSFSLERIRSVQQAAPELPTGWITLSKLFPIKGVDLIGPFWPLMLINPLYVWLAHRNGQLTCPLDPVPEPRLWYYRLLGCDAVLTDDPGKTRRALGR